MAKFSNRSKQRLGTCHYLLSTIFTKVIESYDCKILCGHRTEDAQTEAFEAGFSKVKWPDSKHNKLPSEKMCAFHFVRLQKFFSSEELQNSSVKRSVGKF